MSDDDYPAAALRAEEGRIVLRGLIDPRGRLIFTMPLVPGRPARLLNPVRAIYGRRQIAAVDLGALRTTPYMWVELPAVMFRIAG